VGSNGTPWGIGGLLDCIDKEKREGEEAEEKGRTE
jgi:hypothetical protein